ncbi:DUF4400 domain-containing protein [Thauera butanivorans]|uniref:DUF4400 domain-containing protein n=1 Tax=Thauera butanivorans TaxID=86174 RepID=UPI000837DB38|nr:DUF4400 domain-containing protein [Thauera butanivorans]
MAGETKLEDGVKKAIWSPFRTVLFLGLALLVAVAGRMLIDLAYTGSDPARMERLRQVLVTEVTMADETLPHILGSPSERAMRWALGAYDILYVKTGLDRSMIATPSDFTELDRAVRRGVDAAVAQPHWQSMMLGTQLLAARAALLPSLFPTLLFAWSIGLVDGAVARWKRRAGGGLESSTIYHRAKYSNVSATTIALVVWFWSPMAIELWQLGLFLALLGGILLRIQLMYYKKYI